MRNYASANDYNVFYDNCETAALTSLQQAGVADTFFVPFSLPNELYGALRDR